MKLKQATFVQAQRNYEMPFRHSRKQLLESTAEASGRCDGIGSKVSTQMGLSTPPGVL